MLGDSAATADLGPSMDEAVNNKVLRMRQWLVDHPFEGQKDVIAAYGSVTVYFDPFTVKKNYKPLLVYQWIESHLRNAFDQCGNDSLPNTRLHQVPVWYNGPGATDINFMAETKNISPEEIIRLHSEKTYRVYMIGFMPGFAYMGKVDDLLVSPRKKQPALVAAGSVGIAGEQTGIYPFESPGGWNIIGRTPLSLFDPRSETPVWLKPGDQVKFYPISAEEFEGMRTQ